jgi:hypothetical protein
MSPLLSPLKQGSTAFRRSWAAYDFQIQNTDSILRIPLRFFFVVITSDILSLRYRTSYLTDNKNCLKQGSTVFRQSRAAYDFQFQNTDSLLHIASRFYVVMMSDIVLFHYKTSFLTDNTNCFTYFSAKNDFLLYSSPVTLISSPDCFSIYACFSYMLYHDCNAHKIPLNEGVLTHLPCLEHSRLGQQARSACSTSNFGS